MKKSLVISEQDSIAAILENDRVVEFFVNRGELLLGDIYSATVENILPGIDAAFVNLGKDKMGFLHANDVPGQGALKERLVPKQKLLVQITKEPTGHKGPRVSTAISLPGRFLVLVPEERGVSISRRISEARERARLKSVVNLMKPPGVGLIIRTEAKGQGEGELFEDFEQLWDRWQSVVSEGEASIGPSLIYRDQDLLYRVIRDAYSHEVNDIICDTPDGQRRAQEYLQGWAGRQTKVSHHLGDDSILVSKGIDREIEAALSDRVELPSGGHLNIQPTEALTVIDVNSGRFTSSRTQAETVRRTNLEAAQEIPRQLRLRNIGGMVIVDFIDMDSRKDQQQVLEVFQRVLEEDRAKPQVGQLSDLGLVELTRRRQGQSLRELFTVHCTSCAGHGVVPTLELGHAENRRVISFKFKDEEQSRGRQQNRRPMRGQGGSSVMRAATAHNGRIVPSMEAPSAEQEPDQEHGEEHMEFVSEDILSQVPDDLLLGDADRKLKNTGKRAFESEDDNEEGEEESHFEGQSENFSPAAALMEENFSDDDESHEGKFHAGLDESISEVEKVYHEMDSRVREPEHDFETNESESEIVLQSGSGNAGETHIVEEIEQEKEREEPLVSFAASSPFETELDPDTGIYRLKAKPQPEESREQHSQLKLELPKDSAHSESNWHSHAHNEGEGSNEGGDEQHNHSHNEWSQGANEGDKSESGEEGSHEGDSEEGDNSSSSEGEGGEREGNGGGEREGEHREHENQEEHQHFQS